MSRGQGDTTSGAEVLQPVSLGFRYPNLQKLEVCCRKESTTANRALGVSYPERIRQYSALVRDLLVFKIARSVRRLYAHEWKLKRAICWLWLQAQALGFNLID
jgi:hypothetical protein